jgi:hypothetical protein
MQILLLVRFAQHGCPTMETDKAQSFLLLLVGGRKMLVPVGWAKRFPRAETQERQATAKPSQCEGFKKDFLRSDSEICQRIRNDNTPLCALAGDSPSSGCAFIQLGLRGPCSFLAIAQRSLFFGSVGNNHPSGSA